MSLRFQGIDWYFKFHEIIFHCFLAIIKAGINLWL